MEGGEEFDEFGEHIASGIESSAEYGSNESDFDVEKPGNEADSDESDSGHEEDGNASENSRALTVHENQVSISSTSYAPDVVVKHQSVDTQSIETPLVAPRRIDKETTARVCDESGQSTQLLKEILGKIPSLTRNIAVVGHLNHGKTSLLNVLMEQAYPDIENQNGYLDKDIVEKARGLTLLPNPVSFLAQTSTAKSYAFNCVDTPGHADFVNEVLCGIDITDGIILVVDVIEGPNPTTFAYLKQALVDGKKIIVVLNKIDRLVLDLRVPPSYAACLIHNLVDVLSQLVFNTALEPERLVFASSKFKWAFTLRSFARLYRKYTCQEVKSEDLWKADGLATHVLEPIYKIFGAGLSESGPYLSSVLGHLGIRLTKRQLKQNSSDILIDMFRGFFEDPGWSCLWDSVVSLVPSPCAPDDPNVDSICAARLIRHVSPRLSLIRVMSGSINEMSIVYYGSRKMEIKEVLIPCTAFNIRASAIGLGSIALVSGLESIDKLSASLFVTPGEGVPCANTHGEIGEPVIKLGVKPVMESHTEQVAAAIQSLCRELPGMRQSVSQYGEILLWGTGELYLDSALYRLRHERCPDIAIKCSELSVGFKETVTEPTYAMCPVKSPNGHSSLTVIARPIEDNLIRALACPEDHKLGLQQTLRELKWSQLDINSILTYEGGNILSDDTVDERDLASFSQALCDGFSWVTKNGPLCEESLRGVQFRIAEADISEEPGETSQTQISLTMRNACCAAFLLASPRLLEPWYRVVVVGTLEAGRAVYGNVTRRRGVIESDRAIDGTNFYLIEALIPVIDSFGLESDIRLSSKGLAQVSLVFNGWKLVPGDPLDTNQVTKRLDAAVGESIARDFLNKTRRRLGLYTSPQISDYLDAATVAALDG